MTNPTQLSKIKIKETNLAHNSWQLQYRREESRFLKNKLSIESWKTECTFAIWRKDENQLENQSKVALNSRRYKLKVLTYF
jgi:hypothetical protein